MNYKGFPPEVFVKQFAHQSLNSKIYQHMLFLYLWCLFKEHA